MFLDCHLNELHNDELKAELSLVGAGFCALSPTRVRAASFKYILDNYSVLQKLWEVPKNDFTDPSMKAQIIGV